MPALQGRQDPVVARRSRAAASRRRWCTTGACSSAPRTAPSTRWTPSRASRTGPTGAGGAVKGSPTLSDDGVLFFGAYGGSVHAVRARDGARIWSSSAGEAACCARATSTPRRRSPTAASTSAPPTAARTRSRPRTGAIAWAHQTGRYVYSSAAVKNVDGARADGVLRLLRRHLLRARRPLGQGALDAPLGREDLRLADDRRRHRLLRRPRPARSRSASTPRNGKRRLPLRDRRLRPDHLRRRAPVPDRQPLADRARAAARVRSAAQGQAGEGEGQEAIAAQALVSPAWPESCRQLAPCGPLVGACASGGSGRG